MVNDRLSRMMAQQLEVQAIIQPHVTPILQMNVEERLEAIRYNYIALIQEMSEALQETGWKSWATSRHIHEERMFGELRDVWQFLTNLMFLATQESPEQLAERLETSLYAKHALNIERARNHYDGVSSKCPNCGRALDETILTEVQDEHGRTEKVLCECGTVLPEDVVTKLFK